MPTLKPIKVKLFPRRHANGKQSVWPDFRSFYDQNPMLFEEMLPSHYFDKRGIGWHYDKVDNLGTGAPNGEAYTAIPEAVADALIGAGLVERVTNEPDFESFWNSKAYAHLPEVQDDHETLQAIAAKRALGIAEDQDDINALNPDHPSSGRRRNRKKTWADFKADRAITLKTS